MSFIKLRINVFIRNSNIRIIDSENASIFVFPFRKFEKIRFLKVSKMVALFPVFVYRNDAIALDSLNGAFLKKDFRIRKGRSRLSKGSTNLDKVKDFRYCAHNMDVNIVLKLIVPAFFFVFRQKVSSRLFSRFQKSVVNRISNAFKDNPAFFDYSHKGASLAFAFRIPNIAFYVNQVPKRVFVPTISHIAHIRIVKIG